MDSEVEGMAKLHVHIVDVGAVIAFVACAFLEKFAGENLVRSLAVFFVSFSLCSVSIIATIISLSLGSTVGLLIVL